MKMFHRKKFLNEKGNALIWVLVAVAALALITRFVMQDETGQGPASRLDQAEISLEAAKVLQTAQLYTQTVRSMLQRGLNAEDLSFAVMDDTPPHGHKVFHPSGGGLRFYRHRNFAGHNTAAAPQTGVQGVGATNALNEIIYYDELQQDPATAAAICNAINKRLYTNPPHILSASEASNGPLSVQGGLTRETSSLIGTAGNCPACQNHAAMCVMGDSGQFTFYSLVDPR